MAMQEILNARQIAGEDPRRWFHDASVDLIIWGEGNVSGFQFCWDKPHNEQAITWRADKGWDYAVVDDGEQSPMKSSTPILRSAGRPPLLKIISLLHQHSGDVPSKWIVFIEDRLLRYPG